MPRDRKLVRLLALAAIALAVMAPFVGSPYMAAHASIDVTELARVVAKEEDHVTALELAQWIKDRRTGLRVLDIREPDAYAVYHIPTAERLPLDSLVVTPFRIDETLVLYSDGGAHAAQGWTFLRALGYRRVFFLRGGLNEWLEMVISPTLSESATAPERTQMENVSVLSRYFGGTPKWTGSGALGSAVPLPSTRFDPSPRDRGGDSSGTGKAIIARMRKRGC